MRRFLLAVVGPLLLVTACGGVEQEPNLVKAVERTEATGSARIEVRAVLREDKRALRCEGAADYDKRRLRLACNDDFGEMIAIDDAVYLRGESFGIRGSTGWVKLGTGTDESIFDFSPHKLLEILRSASLGTERVAEADVRGEPAVRYRLTLKCAEAEIACPGATTPVDVWIDSDGLVRRIELEDAGDPGTIEFFDFGVEVVIDPPPADQVHELTDGWTGSGPPQDPNAAPCSEREAMPISEGQALGALRHHGFSARRDGAVCGLGVAAVFTNTDRQDALEREGILHCFLHKQPEEGAPKTVLRSGVDGGDAQLRLANLTCMILADSPNAEEKIRPLEEAFGELEQAIRP